MPQVQNQFAGHMLQADPRSLLFAARGSVWPTIPAFRYRAQSTNATGAYEFFNGDGMLATLLTSLPATDAVLWFGLQNLPIGEAILMGKNQTPATRPGFEWTIGVTPEIDVGFDIKIIARPLSKTNVDLLVGSITHPWPWEGDTGSTFRLRQVVWDETMPPE